MYAESHMVSSTDGMKEMQKKKAKQTSKINLLSQSNLLQIIVHFSSTSYVISARNAYSGLSHILSHGTM